MTFFITAHENTPARLTVSETRTTDKAIADLVVAVLEARGLIVFVRTEG